MGPKIVSQLCARRRPPSAIAAHSLGLRVSVRRASRHLRSSSPGELPARRLRERSRPGRQGRARCRRGDPARTAGERPSRAALRDGRAAIVLTHDARHRLLRRGLVAQLRRTQRRRARPARSPGRLATFGYNGRVIHLAPGNNLIRPRAFVTACLRFGCALGARRRRGPEKGGSSGYSVATIPSRYIH